MLLALGAAASFAQDPLVIRETTGDRTVAISQLDYVSFASDGGIEVVLTSGETITVAADKFVSLRFNTRSAVKEISAEGGKLRLGQGQILADKGGIELYDLQGRKVASTKGRALPLAGFTPGIYVAKAGNSSLKIEVK